MKLISRSAVAGSGFFELGSWEAGANDSVVSVFFELHATPTPRIPVQE